MPRKFKEARQINKLKVIEAAARLGVSQPTLSAWEGERKSIIAPICRCKQQASLAPQIGVAAVHTVHYDFELGRHIVKINRSYIDHHICTVNFLLHYAHVIQENTMSHTFSTVTAGTWPDVHAGYIQHMDSMARFLSPPL